jgi:hypothetical protein
VLGIDAAHSCNRDGSIPSAATSRVQPPKPYTQKISVRVRYAPPLRGVAAGAALFLSRKDESLAASTLGREAIFLCAQRTKPYTQTTLVRIQHDPLTRVVRRWNGIFPVKEKGESLFEASTLERRAFFYAVPLVRQ